MLFFDPPTLWLAKYGPSAHLESDQIGPEGRAELMAFARSIGLRPEWIQKAGTPDEHFDIFKGKLAAARRAGAVEVSRAEAVDKWHAKREAWIARYGRRKLSEAELNASPGPAGTKGEPDVRR